MTTAAARSMPGSVKSPKELLAIGLAFHGNQPAVRRRSLELFWDSQDAAPKRAAILLNRAMALDPENVDGLIALLEINGVKGVKRIAALRKIVEIGQRRLSEEGHFKGEETNMWDDLAARTYLTALFDLARDLAHSGKHDEAIVKFQSLMRLTREDYQRVRYFLVPTLQAVGKHMEAGLILRRFKDDWSHAFQWSRVLNAVLAQNSTQASVELDRARNANSYMETFLIGRTKLAKISPGLLNEGSLEEAGLLKEGSLEEAAFFAPLEIAAWRNYPAAVAWLKGQPAPGVAVGQL